MTKRDKKHEYFDPTEIMPRQEREQYYHQRLQQQVQYAYDNAPAMKAKLDGAGIAPSQIRTIKDLEKIPITTKEQLIDLRKGNPPWGGLLAVPPEKLPRIFMSPGPIYDPQPISDSFYWRAGKALCATGFKPGDIVVNAWSYHMVPAGHLIDESLRRFGATVIPMGVGNTELQVQVLHDMKVTGWVGMGGFLLTILEKSKEMGYSIRRDFSLRIAWVGGEMGLGPIRKRLEEEFGLVTGDQYATADVGGIAYECKQRSGLHILEEVVVEIVDPDTGKQLGPGEAGQVVVTPFNDTYPLIRFGTGDISSVTDEPCPCGRTSLKLTRIMGRIGDAVRTRGIFIYPRQINEVIGRFTEISKYQACVRRPQLRDELILKLELVDESADKENLKTKIGNIFADVCRIKVDCFEFVPRGTIPEDTRSIVDERTY